MEAKNGQIYSKSIVQIIKERISVRSYEPKLVEPALKENLVSYLDKLNGPFGAKVRFKLIDSKDSLDKGIKLGTYGMIRGASSFIASACEKHDMSLEELGYELEKFILYATSLGLGTCWLGGTFKKSEFSKALELKNAELLPIVTPVGYPNKNKSILDTLIWKVTAARSRKSWDEIFFNKSFNKALSESDAGGYKEALEMSRLAPSASNKQPWRIIKDDDTFHFYLCHAKGYNASTGFDMQKIDMGIIMCHFDLTLKEMGISGSFKKCPQTIEIPNENTEYIISWICDSK